MSKYNIDREIRFYRIDCGEKSNGEPKVFNPKPTFEYISKLDFVDGKNYCEDEGKLLACWVSSFENPCKIVLANIRRTDLPLIEYRGELSPLEIPDKAGLSEQTHIVFFENNIVGCDINYFGPRISRLSFYLAQKATGRAPEYIAFNPILRRDVYQQLKKFESIKMLQFKIRSPYIETIANVDDSLRDALIAALKAGGNDDIDIEMILQTTRNSKEPLPQKLLEGIKKLLKKPDIQYDFKTLKVKGHNSEQLKMVELDLLSDKLVIKKEIAKINPKSKGVSSTSAFKAIISAYEEIKDEIEKSPSVI